MIQSKGGEDGKGAGSCEIDCGGDFCSFFFFFFGGGKGGGGADKQVKKKLQKKSEIKEKGEKELSWDDIIKI